MQNVNDHSGPTKPPELSAEMKQKAKIFNSVIAKYIRQTRKLSRKDLQLVAEHIDTLEFRLRQYEKGNISPPACDVMKLINLYEANFYDFQSILLEAKRKSTLETDEMVEQQYTALDFMTDLFQEHNKEDEKPKREATVLDFKRREMK